MSRWRRFSKVIDISTPNTKNHWQNLKCRCVRNEESLAKRSSSSMWGHKKCKKWKQVDSFLPFYLLLKICTWWSCKKKSYGSFRNKIDKNVRTVGWIPEANSWGQCKGYIKTNTNLNAELNISYTILLLRQYNQSQLCHFLLCGSILWKRMRYNWPLFPSP